MSDLDTLAKKLKALGAPGDYGYGTPAGEAIFLAHQIIAAAWLTSAARDVMAERQRQISVEEWTEEHDDHHDAGQLARAAASYCLSACPRSLDDVATAGRLWPWAREWHKPTSKRRDLVKAAALILAEIERQDRAASTEGSACPTA